MRIPIQARNRLLIAVTVAAILCLFYLYSPLNVQQSCPEKFYNNFRLKTIDYRHCILNQLRATDDVFYRMPEIVEACMKDNFWRFLDVRFLENEDESKLVILPSPIVPNEPLIAVTLGIGGDIKAEEKLRDLLPNCKFYGADPISKHGRIFERIGKYFNFGVSGDESGIHRASVLIENGEYGYEDVMTVNFAEFLDIHAKIDKIDFLWIDAEGAEYSIFLRHPLADTKRTICQIDVETHGHLPKYGMNTSAFNDMVVSIVKDTPFIPVWSKEHVENMIIHFYVNVLDKYCVDKYFLGKACF